MPLKSPLSKLDSVLIPKDSWSLLWSKKQCNLFHIDTGKKFSICNATAKLYALFDGSRSVAQVEQEFVNADHLDEHITVQMFESCLDELIRYGVFENSSEAFESDQQIDWAAINLGERIKIDSTPKQSPEWHLHWADDNSFLYHRKQQNQREINSISALIWSLCDGKRTIAEIEDNLVTLFPEQSSQVASDFYKTLELFQKEGLIQGEVYCTDSENHVSTQRKKLCIGMATYDDYDGVYFSVQAIRMYHPEVLEDTEIVVVDNNPSGPCAEPLRALEDHVACFRYVPYDERTSTAVRDVVFREANADYVICIDCHVFLVPGAIKKLINHFEQHPDSDDLYHGPMLYDNLTDIVTHMDPVWRDGMFGTWGTDEKGADPDAQPFEIPMHGAGLFACKKEAWLGFNPRFEGFGGEEGYIHEKFRQAGRKIYCLPFLRWMHRFNRPLGVPYPIRWEQRIKNYLIGAKELGKDTKEIKQHFVAHLQGDHVAQLIEDIDQELLNPFYHFDAIYGINFDANKDQWGLAQQQFDKLGISSRVIPVIAKFIQDNPVLGYGLAHRKVLLKALSHQHQSILVLSDRMVCVEQGNDLMTKLMSQLSAHSWQVLFFGGADSVTTQPIQTVKGENIKGIVRPIEGHSLNAVAYNCATFPIILSETDSAITDNAVALDQLIHYDTFLVQRFEKSYLSDPSVFS